MIHYESNAHDATIHRSGVNMVRDQPSNAASRQFARAVWGERRAFVWSVFFDFVTGTMGCSLVQLYALKYYVRLGKNATETF